MNYNFEDTTIAGRECFVFLPNNYENEEKSYPVVYLHGDDPTYSLLKEADFLSDISFIIIGVISEKRLDELTPWPSEPLHKRLPGFGGNGREYIQLIETKIKEEVDQKYRTLSSPESTGVIGYSLGGLNSIYAAFQTDCFGCFASMSGSFWYPEFVPYAVKEPILNKEARFYMSSGDSEGVGHKDIKKDAVACTSKIYDILVSKVSTQRVTISWDKGGHHDNAYQRYQNAMLWLNNNLKSN
ncbi:alpha/beta hydrolase [Anaerosporobacter sp.]